MARNSEVIRQWMILREIEASRGKTIRQLAEMTNVTTRTIRRDLEALQEAGFPLYDVSDDGPKRWKLGRRPFEELDHTAFNLAELSALYFSRALVERLAIPTFEEDLKPAFAKLESALGPRMRQFLDRLPQALQAKTEPTRRRNDDHQRKVTARLLDAVLHHRRLTMRYHSLSSKREKTYRIDPYRLVYAQGSLYLFAYVSHYQQVRTFAVERIRQLTPLDETFTPIEDVTEAAWPHSLGIFHGKPEQVELEFASEVAPYVQERTWHPSQMMTLKENGNLVVTISVCLDNSLHNWIRSFGSSVRVVSPQTLIDNITDDLERTRTHYRKQK